MKILAWSDFKKIYTQQVCNLIKNKNSGWEFDIIEDITKLTDKHFLDQYDVVLIQITDVTKFSSDEKIRENIGESLEIFANSGKKIIVSHDVLYRRTRNTKLQKMFGYEISNFQRTNFVQYRKTKFAKKVHAFDNLPDIFELKDGEICWGNLSSINNLKIFFEVVVCDPQTNENKIVPLVFGKPYSGGGQLFYFNSADTFDDCPDPILQLNKNYIGIIEECIKTNLFLLNDKETNADDVLPSLPNCDFSKKYSFVCYSSKNSRWVYENCFILSQLGLNFFLDKKNISSSLPGSQGWKDQAFAALKNKNCNSSIIFLSEDFLDSANCLDEIEVMLSEKNNFIPIILSQSLDNKYIINFLQNLNGFSQKRKIDLLIKLLNIDIQNLSIRQIFYPTQNNMKHFFDSQLQLSLLKFCDINIDNLNNAIKN